MLRPNSGLTVGALIALLCTSASYGAQDAPADAEKNPPVTGSVSLGTTFVHTSGDEQNFREFKEMNDDFLGGIRGLDLRVPIKEWGATLDLKGHAMYPDDYGAHLALTKEDVGFFKLDYNQFRSYYDSSNLFYSYPPGVTQLDKDLYTTRRTFGFTLGLRMPDLPAVTLSYERWDKYGDASALAGGTVTNGTITQNFYPVDRTFNEGRDRIHLDVAHDIGNFNLRLSEEFESFRGHTAYTVPNFTAAGINADAGRSSAFQLFQSYPEYTAWTTNFSLKGDILEDVLRLQVESRLRTLSSDAAAEANRAHASGVLSLDQSADSHDADQLMGLVNGRLIYTPHRNISLFAGMGWKQEDTSSTSLLLADTTSPPDGVIDQTTLFDTKEKRDVWTYTAGATVTPLPWLTASADGRWENGSIRYDWAAGGQSVFRRLTTSDYQRAEYTASLTAKVLPPLKAVVRYRQTQVDNDYDVMIDTVSGLPSPSAYPDYIGPNDRIINEISGLLQYSPINSLSVTYKIEGRKEDYIRRKISPTDMAEWDSVINSLSVSVSPVDKLALSAFGSLQNYRVRTDAAGEKVVPIAPYRGDAKVLGLNGTYNFIPRATASAGYTITVADSVFDQKYFDTYVGLTWKINPRLTADARCSYTQFRENGNGNIGNFNATMLTLGLTATF